MNNVTQHPACRPVPALECVDCLDRAVENICAAASMLHTIAKRTRQPVTPEWLCLVARVTHSMAEDIDYTADLWHGLPADSLLAADHKCIAEHVANLRQQADRLEAVIDLIDVCAPSREGIADLTARLLETAQALHQTTEAAWAACRTQPAPAA